MRSKPGEGRLLLALLLLLLPAAAPPPDAGVINVRDHGAVGDGHHDDTNALIAAIEAAGPDAGPTFWRTRIVYLPNGTYRVSRPLMKRNPDGRFTSGMILRGESETGTVIRLTDHAAAFQNPAHPVGVIVTTSKLLDGTPTSGGKDYTGKGEGNDAYENFVEDLTVDVGHANPGAIGIDYLANNVGAIRNVTVTAPTGSGATGVAMQRKWPGPALLQHVHVHGFHTGIAVANTEYGVTLDDVRLDGQTDTGLLNDGNAVSAAALAIGPTPHPIVNRAAGGLIALVGAHLPDAPHAITNQGAVTAIASTPPFPGVDPGERRGPDANDAPARGALLHDGTTTPITPPAFTLAAAPPPSADPPGSWVNAARDAAGADITQSLRKAAASGAGTIYLPYGRYVIHDGITLPPTLRRIIGFNASLSVVPARNPAFLRTQGVLRTEAGTEPLEITGLIFDQTDIGNQLAIQHDADRPLLLRDIVTAGATLLDRGRAGGPVIIEDVCCGPVRIAGPATVTARQLDIEWGKPYLLNDGAPLTILGLKTEGDGTVIDSRNGAVTLVLGGLLYPVLPANPAVPAFRVTNATLAAAFVEEAFNPAARYTRYVQGSHTVSAADFPSHGVAGRLVPWLAAGP